MKKAVETLPWRKRHRSASQDRISHFHGFHVRREPSAVASPNAGDKESVNGSRSFNKKANERNTQWLSGTVCSLKHERQFGFIAPIGPLPEGFSQKDVHFYLNNVIGPDLHLKCQVRFLLDPKSLLFPRAMKVQSVSGQGCSEADHRSKRSSSLSCLSTTGSERAQHVPWQSDTQETTSRSHQSFIPEVCSQAPMINTCSTDGADEAPYLPGKKTRKMAQTLLNTINKSHANYDGKMDSVRATKFRSHAASLTGTFIHRLGDKGFLKVSQKLPSDYNQNKDILFKIPFVKCAEFDLEIGDQFHFQLSTQDKSSPYATYVSLQKCKRRSVPVLSAYVEQVIEMLSSESEQMHGDKRVGVSDFMLELVSCMPVWECLGNCHETSNEYVCSLMNLLMLIEKKNISLKQDLTSIFEILLVSPLFGQWDSPVRSFIQSARHNDNEPILVLVRELLYTMLKYVPEKASRIVALSRDMLDEYSPPFSLERFMFSCFKEVCKHVGGNIQDMNWDEMPLVPTTREILADSEGEFMSLLPVREDSAYQSVDQYVDTYFRLLRADCFHSLKNGIQAFLNGQLDPRDLKVYTHISLFGISYETSGRAGVTLALNITPQQKIKDWSACSNLMFGNLVCISLSGNFSDPVWGTVSNKDIDRLTKEGVIFIELCSEFNTMSDSDVIIALAYNSGHRVMVESPTYYRAYKPVLESLQQTELDKIPFQEELVQGKVSVDKPSYIASDERIIDGKIYNKLDEFQRKSIRSAFNQRVVCIQGPPGTGKTFIGIAIVQNILKLKLVEGPILVVTYKNHALDEMLKALLELFPGEVARIGGRASEELDRCNLNVLLRDISKRKAIGHSLCSIYNEIDNMKRKITELFQDLARDGSLSSTTLAKYLTQEQMTSLLHRHTKRADFKKISDSIAEVREDHHCKLTQTAEQAISYAFKKWYPPKYVLGKLKSLLAPNGNQIHHCKTKQNKELDERVDIDAEDNAEEENERVDSGIKQKVSEVLKLEKQEKPLGNITLITTVYDCISRLPVIKLLNTTNIWELNPMERAQLIQCLLILQIGETGKKMSDIFKQYHDLVERKEDLNDQHKCDILASKSIIGMTVTGASINRNLLAQVKPAVVVVEEAAEVLEPQLIAILGEWVQHLILIGDQNQLRPQVENHTLAVRYHFDVSMMERLINNGIEYTTLNMQNRMKPEFAELLYDIYPKLQSNYERVGELRKAVCMDKSMFFWDHREPETKERSYSNNEEAIRAVKLALLFIQNGYAASDITILAPYRGQVRVMRELMRKEEQKWPDLFPTANQQENMKQSNFHTRIHTIDQYQGDENDIVIVSLVRSNKEKQLGFLKVLNRRCVAQSRAKCGLYFIGNSETLKIKQHWKWLIKEMQDGGCFGDNLPVICQNHPNTIKLVKTAFDIPLEEAFCKVPCGERLPCGKHKCERYCQPKHKHMLCKKKCPVRCANGHPCTGHCYPPHNHQEYPHDPCKQRVMFTFADCGHDGYKLCHKPQTDLCKEKVHHTFPECGHSVEKKCSDNMSNKTCKIKCVRLLTPCNHLCDRLCGEPCNHNSCSTCLAIKQEEERQRKIEEKHIIEMAKNQMREEIKKLQNLDNKKLSMTQVDPEDHQKLVRMVESGIPPDINWKVTIKDISEIDYKAAKLLNLQCREKANDPTRTEWLFLKTDSSIIESLKTGTFDIQPEKGDHGVGIYLSQYLPNPSSTPQYISEDTLHVMIVEANIGKCKRNSRNVYLSGLKATGHDSIFIQGARYVDDFTVEEYAVANKDMVLPLYIVEYKLEKKHPYKLEAEALVTGASSKHIIKPERLLESDDPLQIQFRVAESQFLRLLHDVENKNKYKKNIENAHLKMKHIEYHVNPVLLKKFLCQTDKFVMKYQDQSFAKPILAFHGTKEKDTSSIFEENFKLEKLASGSRDKGWYGAGIYFSEFPQTALFYGPNLVACRILPGKTFDIDPSVKDIGRALEPDFDSHRVHAQEDGYGEEFVIFNPDQIVPVYQIYYGGKEELLKSEVLPVTSLPKQN